MFTKIHTLRNAASLLAIIAMAATGFAQNTSNTQLARRVGQALGVAQCEVHNLEVLGDIRTGATVTVPIGPTVRTLLLRKYSLRSPDFQVWVQDATGDSASIPPPPCRTVRGEVLGLAGSVVVGSLVDGRLTAMVRTADAEWYIQPAQVAIPGAAPGLHAVYNKADVLEHGGVCDVGGRPARGAAPPVGDKPEGGSEPNGGGGGGTLGTNTYACEISIDSDVEFYQAHSFSVTETVNDIELVMVGVDAIYRSSATISYVVNRIWVRTAEPDPYTTTNGDDLLDELTNYWNDNYASLERDVVHLFTGKDIWNDGSGQNLIGIAHVGVICTSGAYSLVESLFSTNYARRVAVSAHELGHNWDAQHCDGESDCRIMCATLGGCSGNITSFAPVPLGAILSHRNSRGCLDISSDVIYVRWSYSGSENGSSGAPYNTFREGVWAVNPNGRVIIWGGNYSDRIIVRRPMRLEARSGSGTVVIGR